MGWTTSKVVFMSSLVIVTFLIILLHRDMVFFQSGPIWPRFIQPQRTCKMERSYCQPMSVHNLTHDLLYRGSDNNRPLTGEFYQLFEFFGRVLNASWLDVYRNISQLKNFHLAFEIYYKNFTEAKIDGHKMTYKIKKLSINSFLIHETDTITKKQTNGGTTFRVLIYGDFVHDFCNYYDHFNGSYSVVCPLCDFCHTFEIIQHLTFFQSYFPKAKKYKATTVLKLSLNKTCNYTSFNAADYKTCQTVTGTSTGAWIKVPKNSTTSNLYFQGFGKDEKIAWYDNYGCIPRYINYWEISNCIRNFRGLYIVGDSTSRNFYYYLLNEIHALQSTVPFILHSDHHRDNLHYMWATTGANLQRKIQRLQFYKKKVNSANTIITFNALHHDIQGKQIPQLVMYWERFIKDVMNIKKRNPLIQLLWLSGQGVRETDVDTLHGEPRNNFLIRGMNHYCEILVRKYGIDMFDRFHMGAALKGLDAGSAGHLLEVVPKTHKYLGMMGRIISNQQLLYMCQTP